MKPQTIYQVVMGGRVRFSSINQAHTRDVAQSFYEQTGIRPDIDIVERVPKDHTR